MESIDISKTIERKDYLVSTLDKATKAKADKVIELNSKTAELEKIINFLKEFDVVSLNKKKEEIKDYQSKLSSITQDLQLNNKESKHLKDKIKLLGEVPCGTQFPTCKFIKDAIDASNKITDQETKTESLRSEQDKLGEALTLLNPDVVEKELIKYQSVINKQTTLEKEILQLKIDVEKFNTIISNINK